MTEYGKALRAITTPIPGLLLWDLPVHGDNRGWFKENWQRAKMVAAGMPDFGPVQNNISFNDAAGTTRGIHAEPWDKFISVGSGRIFGAWVDLRSGPTFGTVFSAELDPSRAVFVPRGVGNGFQTLEPNTVYTYLVNDHYSPDVAYPSVHPGDETLAIKWPIPLEQAELSAKDRAQLGLSTVTPLRGARRWCSAPGGQLGSALRTSFGAAPHVEFADRDELDLAAGRSGFGPSLAGLRHDHQRRRLHSRRRSGNRGGTRGRVGGERHRRGRAGANRECASNYVGAHIKRLRVRWHGGSALPGRRPAGAAGRVRADEGGRRSDRVAPCRATTSCVRRG